MSTGPLRTRSLPWTQVQLQPSASLSLSQRLQPPLWRLPGPHASLPYASPGQGTSPTTRTVQGRQNNGAPGQRAIPGEVACLRGRVRVTCSLQYLFPVSGHRRPVTFGGSCQGCSTCLYISRGRAVKAAPPRQQVWAGAGPYWPSTGPAGVR